MIERRHEATARKVLCPNGCGLRIYRGNLDRHLRACTRTAAEREQIALERTWRRWRRAAS